MQPGRSSSIGKSENAPKMVTGGGARLSDDRLMQSLAAVAVLLFVSVGALSLGRARYSWVNAGVSPRLAAGHRTQRSDYIPKADCEPAGR